MAQPKLTIEYCAPCNYLPRTVWQVQELMASLTDSVESVELIPADGGRYRVTLGDEVLFSKEEEGRFPDPSELLEAAFASLKKSES
jgi:selenoprotein W-related protein